MMLRECEIKRAVGDACRRGPPHRARCAQNDAEQRAENNGPREIERPGRAKHPSNRRREASAVDELIEYVTQRPDDEAGQENQRDRGEDATKGWHVGERMVGAVAEEVKETPETRHRPGAQARRFPCKPQSRRRSGEKSAANARDRTPKEQRG